MTTTAPDFSQTGLSSDNRVPLYHQIYLILRAKIFDGEYGHGSYLPGERELGETFSVSRITAVRALNELAAAGLVVRERGRGTRVQIVGAGLVARGPTAEGVVSLKPVGDDDEPGGRNAPKITIHEFADVTPPAPVAAALKLPQDALVQEAVRVSRFNGKPFNHMTTYVPQAIGRHWTRDDLKKNSMAVLLARVGVEIALVEERVTATLADILLAERLEVAVGSPLIKITRLSLDAHDAPIDYFVGFYPPDRYQYVVSLPRHQVGDSLYRRDHP